MKVRPFVGLAAVTVGMAAATGVSTAYGPNNCVSLSLSPKSTCVITTDCIGDDTTLFEFAFDCVAPDANVVQHSFGFGGFNAEEEYDSEVECQKCYAPVVVAKTPKKLAAKAPPAARPARTVLRPSKLVNTAHVLTAAKVESKTTQSSVVVMASSADGYGPNGCVSTWKNPSGRCVMKTDCEAADITTYDFGLVCVDKSGQPVQHLFGVGSFSASETFDTLISCDSCLGTNFQALPKDVAVAGQINVLFSEVSELKGLMANMSKKVEMLEAQQAGPAAASPAPAAPAPAAASASFMLHRSEQVESADEDEQLDEVQPPPQPKKHHAGRKAAKNPKLRATPKEDEIPVAQAQDESSVDSSEDGGADANAGTVADASDLGSSDDSPSRDDASAGDGQAPQQDADGASDSQAQQQPQDVEVDDGFDG